MGRACTGPYKGRSGQTCPCDGWALCTRAEQSSEALLKRSVSGTGRRHELIGRYRYRLAHFLSGATAPPAPLTIIPPASGGDDDKNAAVLGENFPHNACTNWRSFFRRFGVLPRL